MELVAFSCAELSHWWWSHASELLVAKKNCSDHVPSIFRSESEKRPHCAIFFSKRSDISTLVERFVYPLPDTTGELRARGLFTAFDLRDSHALWLLDRISRSWFGRKKTLESFSSQYAHGASLYLGFYHSWLERIARSRSNVPPRRCCYNSSRLFGPTTARCGGRPCRSGRIPNLAEHC